MENKIAVLLTCHNRKKVTQECLGRLKRFENTIDIYCVDDASTDGTFQMIQSEFPKVKLIEGDGNLFWCRGMLKAWQHAVGSGIKYDYYFWLNDDLKLFEDSFDEVLECCRLTNNRAIITGLVIESKTQAPIYGGSWNKKLIAANGEMNRVNGLNGNFVAVPHTVMKDVGLFDPVYHHDLGDVDYGLSAIEKGFEVLTTRKYIGETDGNLKSSHKRNRRWGVSMRERFRVLFSPLGSNPNITFHFMNKHRGMISALVYYAYVIGINILPDKIFKYIER